ncbi:uncharacterized protein LOC130677543 [Microplitis mediator]|uniref:uncharacterized protein LOC130677543 n=1 Tax=Microplitis mediator TaxID=375433 RepID=UPI00255561BE|nr:uncharacterized protein LOC130677543 [Microplitis mediator]
MTLLKFPQSKHIVRKYKLLLILYLLIIAIATLAVLINDAITKYLQVSKIRAAMLSEASFGTHLSLDQHELNAASSYVFMTNAMDYESIPHKLFAKCWTTETNFGDLCEFGIKLIVLYKRWPKYSSRYLQIVEDIIRRILEKFKTIILPKQKFPWGENWFAFSVRMTKLLIMYIYLGPDDNIKFDSYKLIMRMNTDLDVSNGQIHGGINVVYLSIPRLCGTYYYDKKLFYLETDKNYDKFQKLIRVLNIKYNEGSNIKNGAYADGSYIEHRNVATFSYFVTMYGFYEEVYKSFGFPSNIQQVARNMLDKLLHPDMPWLQLGLFGRNGSRYNTRKWWNITGTKGGFNTIALMPFIGLGVFKADDFMISVRVQRRGIAAYETDPQAKGQFALGWVQLRRIYIAGKDYERTLTWDTLKTEPGLLIPDIPGGGYKELLAAKHSTTKSFCCKNVNSFIGRLMDHNLMFWKNTYDFHDVYGGTSCLVSEAAVVTTHGLEAYYKIHNNCGKNLKFIWKDTINELAINDVAGSNKNGDFVIRSGETKYFTWRMLVRDGINSHVMLDSEDTLTFKCDSKNYTVKSIIDNEKFVVTRDRQPILVGTSNSDPNDSTSYGECGDIKYYARDPNTMMYDLNSVKTNMIDK